MAQRSSIEWTEVTWNPVTGCTKISQGCKFCYAERLSRRLHAMGVEKYRDGFSVAVHDSTLGDPLRWRQPRLVFVNSMSDLFHKSVPSTFIEAVFDVMNRASRHTFQVLTKRPSRVGKLVPVLSGWAAGNGRRTSDTHRSAQRISRVSPPKRASAWLDHTPLGRMDHAVLLNLMGYRCPALRAGRSVPCAEDWRSTPTRGKRSLESGRRCVSTAP